MVGLWALLRTRVLGQTALAATAAVMEARLASRLSDAVWNPLRALAFEVQSALSTQDALALAEAVVQLLAQAVSAAADNAPARGRTILIRRRLRAIRTRQPLLALTARTRLAFKLAWHRGWKLPATASTITRLRPRRSPSPRVSIMH